ncbi:MAG: cupin domain-containing protein [Rubrobacteraceae bacterium]|uniref:cupin domain-containing protein n=1 Tax=Rubrobacter naiadicus TaxID=1392641 RepID=UPI0023631274|nr:cupin domain-containing protein [Rubrobacter naiadicus]MBX6764290.1 cupin domain-containing protein [Rubrobacteraceae bacterium]
MSGRERPVSGRALHGPVQRFDIEEEAGRLRSEEAWKRGGRNAITLRKGQGMNVVLLVMRAGDVLDEHAAPGPFSLNVVSGRVRFAAAGEEMEVGAGTLVACDAGVRHRVEALEESVGLITIAKRDGGDG